MVLDEQREDLANSSGFLLVDDEAPARGIDIVAEYRRAPDPLAFAAGRRHLVAGAFTDDFSLELGERKQDVQRQPAERRSGVELLGYGDETDRALVKPVHQPGEIQKRPAQPVHL